jgi:hypothetical protein
MARTTVATTIRALAVVLLGSQLQAAPLPGFAKVAETSNFVFYSRDGQAVDATKTQKFFETLAKDLGCAPSGQTAYYRYEYAEQVTVATGVVASGVTLPESGEIHSSRAYHPHELVHRLAATLGNPGRFFQEGLAVALGDGGVWNGVKVDALAVRLLARAGNADQMIDAFDRVDPNEAYPLAGSFVQYLVKTHGAKTVATFFHACSNATDRDASFAKVFGCDLGAATKAWAASLKA